MDQLTLTAPEPVAVVEPARATGLVPVDETTRGKLEQRVDDYVRDLCAMTPNSPEFAAKGENLASLGQREIRDATAQSNRFLDKPVRAMEGGVGADLVRLRGIVEDLDPGRKGDLLSPRKLLGLIPFGNKLQTYFDGYKSAQTHIAAILRSLASGRDELLMDNAAVDGERQRMWQAMSRLEQMILLAAALDRRLEEKAADLDATDPAKAKAIRETALFHARQRHQDLLVQMAVTVQGYLALDLVKRNNVELIKGVDRATTTTVAALRTAVTVAQALANQRLVLDQIGALNQSTASIIEGTGRLMRENTARINEQAASATIPLETLKAAFANIYATMDSIDGFKAKALSSMKTTIDALDGETAKAKARLAAAGDSGPTLSLEAV